MIAGQGQIPKEILVALREKGINAELVHNIDKSITRLSNFMREAPLEAFLIGGNDRHMKNSPYPAKKRGKGKRNKY